MNYDTDPLTKGYLEQLIAQQGILSESIRRNREEGRLGTYGWYKFLDDAMLYLNDGAMVIPSFAESLREGGSIWSLMVTIITDDDLGPIRMRTDVEWIGESLASINTTVCEYSLKKSRYSVITGVLDGNIVNVNKLALDFQTFAVNVVDDSY